MELKGNRWTRYLLYGILLLTIGISIAAILIPPGRGISSILTTVLFLIPGLGASIACLLIFLRTKHQTAILQSAGIILMLLGDWLVLHGMTNKPFSAALIHWTSLGGWICLFGSWFFLPLLQRRSMMRLKVLLDIAISTGAFVVLCWLLFLEPFSRQFELDSSSQSWILFYPILGLVLISILFNLILLTPMRTIRLAMVLFLAGMVFLTISDFAIGIDLQADQSALSSVQAYGYVTGYSLICLYAIYLLRAKDPFPSSPVGIELSLGERVQPVLALALALVLVGELIVFWQFNRVIPQTVVGFSAMVWLLLIARQGVAAGEFELQQYAMLFNHSAEPSFLCKPDLKLILVNPAMLKICQEEDDNSLMQKRLPELFINYPSPKLDQEEVKFEAIFISKLNEEIPVDVTLQVLQLGLLRRKTITGVIHDLSSQKKQQRDLQLAYDRVSKIRKELIDLNNDLERRVEEKTGSLSQAYQQLEEQHRKLQSLDKLKSDFVTMVSHELRAPLTNISGGIELVLTGKNQMTKGSQNSLQLVQAEIQRLTRIVESILDLSALDSGRMPLYPEPIQIEDLLPSVQALASQYRDGSRFQYEIPKDLPIFLADPQALISILSYILDNAVKYAPQGPITLSAMVQGDMVEFCVSDGGPGISATVIDQIFDKFYRADNTDSRDIYGRGLGLYMAKRLIEAMGGTITAANRLEGGAVFSIRLPLMADAYEKENPLRG